MNKKNDGAHYEKQEVPLQSTSALLAQWVNQRNQSMLFRFAIVLIPVIIITGLIFLSAFAIRQFESSWYSIYFFSKENELSWTAIFMVGIDILRWLSFLAICVLIILSILTPENSQISDLLFTVISKTLIVWLPILLSLIGLRNLVLFSVIGWKHINITEIGEGIVVFLFCIALVLIFLGSKIQTAKKSILFESLFNLDMLLFPVIVVVTSSVGGFKTVPQWFLIAEILLSLFILVVGIDEIKGKPSIYTHLVTAYRILETGHASLQTLRTRSAEALANALLVYKRMSPEQQEILAKWILDNNKPSFINRFWAIAKIVVSTILLTILVQEPAIIIFKWFLKTVFDFSY